MHSFMMLLMSGIVSQNKKNRGMEKAEYVGNG